MTGPGLAESAPRDYNAAADLIESNLAAGRGGKTAFTDDAGSCTYAELAERVDRFANALLALGIEPEQRVVLCLLDGIDFPVAFLGAIKAGIVPVPVNTLLTRSDYDFILSDSRARALVVSDALLDRFEGAADRHPGLRHVVVSGAAAPQGRHRFADLLAAAPPRAEAARTTRDDVCFWLYSSGSTGSPKGTVHVHASLRRTADLYAVPVLGIREDDVVYSAAKLFFAYGLGNALTFPMAVGATAVLTAERPTPALVSRILRERRPTIFYGVPTLYGALLASSELPGREELALRRCTSAGEALPPDLGRRWTERTGVEILDGLGSTEMLHIFLSNHPGEVRYGTSGRPVAGYRVRIVDEAGNPVPRGEVGELQVEGPTGAAFYWNNRERSRTTFLGPWTRSGDKYVETEDGYFVFCGRSDDMLKVGGIYVSPFEVEGALLSHPDVLEAAVVGQADESGLIKPKAYVVLKPGVIAPDADMAEALQCHVKERLAPFKYPRWIEFLPELPKTATGKVQRFKLRASATPAVQAAG
ncbi:benzoate-CoA ligase family protein [Arenibaculum sp.]|uniref:benzoate-CoA ligase family protein n=1 Tax=Arenibaculum sp. TaxID=2865862 RepID=UPI002E14AA3D|nr:benzoate-CoA ligase family protein [Arenibaculum sp.]